MEPTPTTPPPAAAPPTTSSARSRYEIGVLLTKIAVGLLAADVAWSVYDVFVTPSTTIPGSYGFSAVAIITGLFALLLLFAIPACAILGVTLFAFAQRPLSPAALTVENHRKLIWGIILIAGPAALGATCILVALLAFFTSGFGAESARSIFNQPVGKAIGAGLWAIVSGSFLPGVTCGILLLTSRRKAPYVTN